MGGLVHNARVICADGTIADWISVEDGRIDAIGVGPPPRPPAGFRIDAGGGWVLPGFVDVHVHGTEGHAVMDGRPEAIVGLARVLARRGVTTFAPSTVSAAPEELAAAVAAIAATIGPVPGGATVLGAHLEGPWISSEHRGAHPPTALRPPDRGEVADLLATGAVRSVTLAPELPGAGWLLEAVQAAGAVAVIGHTDATAAQVHDAADAGATHVTHLFNAMRGFHHREAGAVGAALTDPRLTCELIADGVHVCDDALRLAWRVLGAERAVLVSDANPATGLGDGEHRFVDRRVHVEGDRATLADGTIAGSVTTVDATFARLGHVLGEPPSQLWPVVSRTPARALGVGASKGELSLGRDADLVVLDNSCEVRQTVVAGLVVFDASET